MSDGEIFDKECNSNGEIRKTIFRETINPVAD
jgi:hypothetical protein